MFRERLVDILRNGVFQANRKGRKMDIKPAMSKFGFGHRGSRHVVVDHEGELWLAMAPVAVGGFLPMGATTMPGTLRVEPLEGGKAVPFTYTATESLLELTTKKGGKVKIAVDNGAGALRIEGNTAFRLNGGEAASFVTTLNTPQGVIVSAGTNRYLFTAAKGKTTFDDSWILNQFHSVPPVLTIEPENGDFQLIAYDLPADHEAPKISKTLDECAAENSAEFKAFLDTLVEVPAEWADVKEKIAYPIWLCHRVLTGEHEVIVENKRNSKNTDSRLMSIASLAFKDARTAVQMLLAYPVGMPPVAGVAAARLLEDNMLNDSRGEIYKVYAALETAARECVMERTVDNDGLSYYAYRFESALGRSPEFFKAGEPVLAPDLNAYLIIISEVLGKLAKMEYDDGIAKKWTAHSKSLFTQLIAQLWNGEDFVGKNTYTGEQSEPDDFLSLVPILLGGRLPSDIIKKLAPRVNSDNTDSAAGLLLAGGLFDAGEKKTAKDIAQKALKRARTNGVSCPFYGASLLALAHKVL